jgi:hypothetical protein
MAVTREQITKGATLRIIGPCRNRPVGTIARVTDTGVLSYDKQWWFTVEWLTYLPKASPRSLRLFEEDLPAFELVTGPVEIPTPAPPRKKRDMFKPASPQLSLPSLEGSRRR